MEGLLFEWCIEEIEKLRKPLSRSMIKQQARVLSQKKGTFKASKGWLDKFMKRFNYAEKVKEILIMKKEGMEEEK